MENEKDPESRSCLGVIRAQEGSEKQGCLLGYCALTAVVVQDTSALDPELYQAFVHLCQQPDLQGCRGPIPACPAHSPTFPLPFSTPRLHVLRLLCSLCEEGAKVSNHNHNHPSFLFDKPKVRTLSPPRPEGLLLPRQQSSGRAGLSRRPSEPSGPPSLPRQTREGPGKVPPLAVQRRGETGYKNMVEGIPEPPYPVGGLNFPLTDSLSLSLPLCKVDAVEHLPMGLVMRFCVVTQIKPLKRPWYPARALKPCVVPARGACLAF